VNEIIKDTVETFFQNNLNTTKIGRFTELSEIGKYDKYLGGIVPNWYKDLLVLFPIAELQIEIPNDYGQEDFIGKPIEELPKLTIRFNSYREIYEEAYDYFPGSELKKINYLCIAKDIVCTQEGIYINTTKDDPSIQLVFHDFGETTKELIDNSETLLGNFSDIFNIGTIVK
jgi:hypothetical protein